MLHGKWKWYDSLHGQIRTGCIRMPKFMQVAKWSLFTVPSDEKWPSTVVARFPFTKLASCHLLEFADSLHCSGLFFFGFSDYSLLLKTSSKITLGLFVLFIDLVLFSVAEIGIWMWNRPGRHILSIFSFKLFFLLHSPNNTMEVIKVRK